MTAGNCFLPCQHILWWLFHQRREHLWSSLETIQSKVQSRFCSELSFTCGIHMEVNNLEFNSVETDLLYRLRISSKMPFPCPVSDSLNLGSVLSLQMAHINKADSHTSVSNLSTSPLRLYRHIGGVTLTTDPVLLVCWPDNRIQRKGGKVESTEQHGQSETGTGSLVGMCRQLLLQPAIFLFTGEFLSSKCYRCF